MPIRPRHLMPAALALAVAHAGPAPAQDLTFAMDVAREQSDLRYDDGRRIDTRETRVSASFREPLTPHLDGTLTLGASWVSQDGDPATEGEDLTGGFGGLALEGVWPLNPELAVEAAVGWQYHRASGDGRDGDITLERHVGSARGGLRLSVEDLSLAGGALYQYTDGERRVDGLDTQGFETDDDLGIYARVGLGTGAGGAVAVEAVTGPWRGVRLIFSRRFR